MKRNAKIWLALVKKSEIVFLQIGKEIYLKIIKKKKLIKLIQKLNGKFKNVMKIHLNRIRKRDIV